MAGLSCSQIYILLHFLQFFVVADDHLFVSCPTSKNQPVNITRISDRIAVIWFTNNDNPITNAVYNSTRGGCLLPSNTAGYTTYCEEYTNNTYKFTLQVHQPVEGDLYFTNDDQNTTTTIIFQDCSVLSHEAKIGIGVSVAVVVVIIVVFCLCFKFRRTKQSKNKDSKKAYSASSKTDVYTNTGKILKDENIEYVGGIFSDSVQYAVVNKKPQDERKRNEIIVDENVEYVGLGEVVSPPVVPTRGYKESKKTKKGEELKYAEVDFSNQKPSTKIRGHGTKQSTVNYADINHFNIR